ncbi:MAG: tRNA (cytidine(56)-2'-O)-methyltransferase [Candidatus Aenigmarchaeota archaeon]|nr:tRNA (cytidine(56)-2'-O)-methyltransferase [Candidatus Aenigmarchaeota archaeon]
MSVIVFRLGHRIGRDHRITTHCGLVARAFGADKMLYSGQQDSKMEATLGKVSGQWGGSFSAEYTLNAIKTLRSLGNRGRKLVHLTVYGMPVQKKTGEIRKTGKNIVVIVGGEKVPPEIYQLADWNISVTGQPHSEISALAVFLDRLFGGKELEKKFPRARLRIIPKEKGKKVLRA